MRISRSPDTYEVCSHRQPSSEPAHPASKLTNPRPLRCWGNRRSRPSAGLPCGSGWEPCGSKQARPAYSWWGSFLHGFVVPNSGWIGILVAVAEFAIGIAPCLGLFTPAGSTWQPGLLFTYVMSGTASVCAFYALFGCDHLNRPHRDHLIWPHSARSGGGVHLVSTGGLEPGAHGNEGEGGTVRGDPQREF